VRIATWNVNSIKKRLPHVLAFLDEVKPDVLLLQEIKCVDADFPQLAIEGAGYHAIAHGQKAYNGVALIARGKIEDPLIGLPGGGEDVQSRYVEGTVGGVRVASIYLPNGNPVGTEKYPYKLNWMDRLIKFAHERLKLEEPMVLCGDYNVIPAAADARRPEAWVNDALFLPQTREKFRSLINLGLTDAIRAVSDSDDLFTFWDYQAGAFQKNDGIRIDHLLLSPQAADKLLAAGVDKHVRGWEKPSDHVPVWIDLAVTA
jgi:exodeoxyribonuclease-3